MEPSPSVKCLKTQKIKHVFGTKLFFAAPNMNDEPIVHAGASPPMIFQSCFFFMQRTCDISLTLQHFSQSDDGASPQSFFLCMWMRHHIIPTLAPVCCGLYADGRGNRTHILWDPNSGDAICCEYCRIAYVGWTKQAVQNRRSRCQARRGHPLTSVKDRIRLAQEGPVKVIRNTSTTTSCRRIMSRNQALSPTSVDSSESTVGGCAASDGVGDAADDAAPSSSTFLMLPQYQIVDPASQEDAVVTTIAAVPAQHTPPQYATKALMPIYSCCMYLCLITSSP